MMRMLELLWLLGTAGAMKGHLESELLEHLFVKSGYNQVARPIVGSIPNIRIESSFGLNAIVKFDENKQVLKTAAWITVSWNDSRLAWNGSVSSLKHLIIPAGMVWRPWLYVINSINGFELLRNDDDEVLVFPSGFVRVIMAQPLETMCSMDISKYPFDTQRCNITFGPIFGFVSNTSLHCLDCSVKLSSYDKSTVWDLENGSITFRNYTGAVLDGLRLLNVELTLKRRNLFYILTLILPIPCLSVITPTVFVLPPDGGEKISLAVSVLLSYTIFLSGLSTSLPPNSDKMCFFSVYLALMVLISALSALLAAVIISLHSRQGHVTRMWRYIICASRERKKSRVGDVTTKTEPPGRQNVAWQDESQVTWREVAHFLDRVGLVMCIVFTVGVSGFYVVCIFLVP